MPASFHGHRQEAVDFVELHYAVRSGSTDQQVFLRSEYGPPCGCPCYFVTNRDDEATHLDDAV